MRVRCSVVSVMRDGLLISPLGYIEACRICGHVMGGDHGAGVVGRGCDDCPGCHPPGWLVVECGHCGATIALDVSSIDGVRASFAAHRIGCASERDTVS